MNEVSQPANVGRHIWADESGKVTAKQAGTTVANWILSAGGLASTAFRCALAIAEDIEKNPSKFKQR